MPDLERNWPFSHNRIREANPGMWQDFYVEGRPFGKVSMYANDFHSWVADEWTVTEVGTCTQDMEDARNGVLTLTSGTTENNGAQIQLGGTGDGETTGEAWAPSAGKNLWFECSVYSNDVTQNDIFVGLHVQDTTFVASRGADYIGFRTDDGDALLDCESSASSSASSETSLSTLVDATAVKLGFKVTGTSKVEYYVNDVLKSTISTNVPTALMKLSLGNLTGEAAANTLSIDYVVVAQDR